VESETDNISDEVEVIVLLTPSKKKLLENEDDPRNPMGGTEEALDCDLVITGIL